MLGSEVKILDKNLTNMIAAGEVVERPASVVKELVENSLDAVATKITIEVKNGGKTYIRVTDDGIGMTMHNAKKAFLRHATSKISSIDDLQRLTTMGFRGEALAAISSVSKVEVMSSTVDDACGTHLVSDAGDVVVCDEMGLPIGTTIIVRDLFFNTPARYNFLKKDSTETANIVSLVHKLAISRTNVSFTLIVDGKTVLSTNGNSSRIDNIYSVLGKELCDNLLEVYACSASIVVEGYVGRPRYSRANRNLQHFFVNGRYVKSKTMTAALDKAYQNSMMNGKHPVCVLYLDVDPYITDVNVHPTKMEIKFSDEKSVFNIIYRAVKEGLEKEIQFNQKIAENPDSVKLSGLKTFYNEHSPEEIKSLGLSSEIKQFLSYSELNDEPQKVTSDVLTMSDEGSDGEPQNPPVLSQKMEFAGYSPRISSKFKDSGYYSRNSRLDISEKSLIFNKDMYDDSYIITPEISYRYVGELFKTYIIIESDNFYYFVDKHAAHERIVFNKIYERYKSGDNFNQMLLTAIPVSLTPLEADVAHRYKKEIVNTISFFYYLTSKSNV